MPHTAELYQEYKYRPFLPGLLVIINHFWLVGKFIVGLVISGACNRKKIVADTEQVTRRIHLFQELHTDRYWSWVRIISSLYFYNIIHE